MKQSAGILLFRTRNGVTEVLLAHPAGPLWGKKDKWSIPKGVVEDNETDQQAAFREFREEMGSKSPQTGLIDLGSDKQNSKVNHIFAAESDFDVSTFVCRSTFTLEWPPRSGIVQEFAENDRAAWFDVPTAAQKVFSSQTIFLERLANHLNVAFEKPALPEQQSLL